MDEVFQDLLADNAEVVIDSLLENEIIKEIPILGSSIRIIRGLQSLRDRAYLNKIKLFIEKVDLISDIQKQRLILESRKAKNKRAKFGDAIFTSIEQSDSTVKIEYIAVVFEAFLNKEIEENDLRQLCHIINNTFSDELIDIIENEVPKIDLKYVIYTGLSESIYEPLKFDGNSEPKYKLSIPAEQLRLAWRKYN